MKITVNGAFFDAVDDVISHADVLRIAFDGRVIGPHRVTFTNANEPAEGDLAPEQTVRIKEGTAFNVYPEGVT